MPDIDRTADVKVTAGWEPVTAEIPLAGHASERWLELFRMLAKSLGPGGPEVNDRDQDAQHAQAAREAAWLAGGATLLLYGIERGHVPSWGVACDLGRGGRI
jgi:hypothetical protein